MRSLTKSIVGALLLLSAVSFTAMAQTPARNDDDQAIKSLLNEVRLLRQTLQNTGLNAYRSQILLERIKISNEQVVRLTRALTELRETVEKTEATVPRMSEQVKMLETMIESEADAAKRTRLEFEAKDMKRSIERYKSSLTQLKEREQEQATQLREEQNKLNELEARLQQLESQIENEIERLRGEPTKRP